MLFRSGGLKFYERKEIKDLISYLRLINNTSDNISLLRIINEPKRGMGAVSVDKVLKISNATGISAYEILKQGKDYGVEKIAQKAIPFVVLIEELKELKEKLSLSELYSNVIEKSGYLEATLFRNTG